VKLKQKNINIKKHTVMKTQKNLISLVLLIAFTGTVLNSQAKNVPDQNNELSLSNQETCILNEPVIHSEILSTKNYAYNEDYLLNKKEVVVFLFDKNAKLIISVDENGEIHEDIEYFDDSNNVKDTSEEQNDTSLLDDFRKNVGNLFNEASEVVLNPNTNNENKRDNAPLDKKKYFKSDYEIINQI